MDHIFTPERREMLAEMFLRAFAKQRSLTVLPSQRSWFARIEEYADIYLHLGFHHLSEELLDIIPHVPLPEEEATAFASLIARGILEREKEALEHVPDLVA